MSIEFFVATEEELANLNDIDELFEQMSQYGIIATGANDFKTVRTISSFFLQNEDSVPNEVIKTLNFVHKDEKFIINIYKFEKEFTQGVASIDKEQLNTPEAIKYWQSRGYFSQGTWNAIYGLYNLCNFAVRDNKDIYIYEEINESELEK